MAANPQIIAFIKKVRNKRLTVHVFYALTNALLLTLAAILISVGLQKIALFSVPYQSHIFISIAILAFLVFFLPNFKSVTNLLNNAIYIDNKFSLKDRFSSYVDGLNKNIPSEISEFQEKFIVNIIPQLSTQNIIESKKLYKHILLCILFIFMLFNMPLSKNEKAIISQEESEILRKQEESLHNFVAYLKGNDALNKAIPNKKTKDISELIEESAKKLQKDDIQRNEAIKLLSKLIDSFENIVDDKKDNISSSEKIAAFDMNKFSKKSDFENFFSLKQKEFKTKIENLKRASKAEEKRKSIQAAREILGSISEKFDSMLAFETYQEQVAADEDIPLSPEDARKLKEELEKAAEELASEEYLLKFEEAVKQMTDNLKADREKLYNYGISHHGSGNDNLAYKSKKKDRNVTFDSRIKSMSKGEASINMGPGTTNENIGFTDFDPAKPQRGKMVHDLTDTDFEKIYVPSRTDTKKDIFVVMGTLGSGNALTISTGKEPLSKAVVNAPYKEVYAEYKRIAQKAITVQNVPRTYKSYVIDYFESINPDLK